MTLIGTTIGKIRIVEQLGKGGMGVVYVGLDETLARKVAVKAIHEGRLNAEAKARFLREAKVLSRLEHPTICRIYDFIEAEGCDYLVMELVRGTDLTEHQERLNNAEKLAIADQIAQALTVAHEQSIVHRDLKPDNVMVTEDGDVKVLDFGLARRFGEDQGPEASGSGLGGSTGPQVVQVDLGGGRVQTISAPVQLETGAYRTERGVIMGTPMFMSPEQAQGESTTGASDMYSLGLLLQWLFTGKMPYPKIAMGGLLIRAMQGQSRVLEGIDTDLAFLINRLKSINPENRPTALDTRNRIRWIRDKAKRRAKRIAIGAFVLLLVLGTTLSSIGFFRAKQSEKRAVESESRAVQEAETAKQTVALLQEFMSSVDPREKGRKLQVIELVEAFKPRLDELNENPQVQASLFHTYGTTYKGLGLYNQAYLFHKKAFDLRTKHLGEVHPDTLASIHNVAQILYHQGKYEEAEALNRHCLELKRRELGEKDPGTFPTMHNLALAIEAQGRHAEAEELFRQLLELSARVLEEDHPETLRTSTGLALALRQQGKYAEAEQILSQSVEISKRVLGEDHLGTLHQMFQLAEVLRSQGKHTEAESLVRQVLKMREEVLGADHPDTLSTTHNLALVLASQGRRNEAVKLYRRAFEGKRRVLGEAHLSTLQSMTNIAYSLFLLKSYTESETMYRQILELNARDRGDDHWQTLNTMNDLAWMLTAQGKHLEEAEELATNCVVSSIRILGSDHRVTGGRMDTLANVLEKRNKIGEAIQWYRKAARAGIEESQEALARLGD